jgi:hypothetical protein
MNGTEPILREWRRTDPDRLLQCALSQAERIGELCREGERLRAENEQWRQQVQELQRQRTVLEEQLAEAQRAAHRAAAPFRVPEQRRGPHPRRPGRAAGHPGACRARPAHIDEEIEVPLTSCPHCGGHCFRDCQAIEQFIEDIPPVRPTVTRLVTYHGTCTGCGQEVCSTHPRQVSTAAGAAGVHLGPRALGLAADLNKAKGLTARKTCAVLREHFGLRLTAGGLVQALHRVAGKLQPRYQSWIEQLRVAPAVSVDETRWWVGGPGWWLWVFTRRDLTVYHVVAARDRAQVHAVLGAHFGGVLVSDCLASYDDATDHQHKCYSHHHRAIADACAVHPQQGGGYLHSVRALLHTAEAVKALTAGCTSAEIMPLRRALEARAEALLSEPRGEPSEERVRRRLHKQRDHLFTFLGEAEVEATNNLAERQLRPAVIARKVSCGNKTARGARTWQVLSSLAATCVQRAESFVARVAQAVRLKPP